MLPVMLSVKFVTNPFNGFETVVSYFFSQFSDVYIYRSIANNCIVSPNTT
jgi:hypothetical protein